MIICGVDLETTGLDKNKDKVTEIGAVLWDTELNAPIKFFNKLIKIDIPVPEFIVALTGITDKLLQEHGEELETVVEEFNTFSIDADFLMAHNAPFDKGFIDKLISQVIDCHYEKDGGGRNWIDSSVDVPYPESIQIRKLTYLACEHGFVNPFAHRAVTDVLTMMQIASRYDWNEIIQNSQTPSVTLKAMVTFDNNSKAKSNSFRWDANSKSWLKQVKVNKVLAEQAKYAEQGFVAKVVG